MSTVWLLANAAIYLVGLTMVFFLLLVVGMRIMWSFGLVPKDWFEL